MAHPAHETTFLWNGYTVRIERKNVRRVNLRIRPEEPSVIHMSVPSGMRCEDALRTLEEPRIRKWLDRYEKRRKERPAPEELRKREEEEEKLLPAYRERLLSILPELFRKWQTILGVRCGKVTIRDTRSQWGSCNTRNGNISISLRLGAYPTECVEYVVVHELAHLLERGHNARFYGILDRHYPAWRECRERLKRRPEA
ncbi:MAG: M48 family metallopeptidase [Eubacteriales bacterium]|nr:M48 family metallopeptidase [Eubacteriales bacterium]